MAEPEPIKDIIDAKIQENERIVRQEQEDEEKAGGNDQGGLVVKKKSSNLGGKRPGSGRPKGSLAKSTMTAMEAKNHFINRVQKNVDTLFNAQLALAKGEQFLYRKVTTGEGKSRRTSVEMVQDTELIEEYLVDDGYSLNQESDEEYYYISTRPANNQAIDSLLNRAFGKAPEKIEIEGGFFKADKMIIEVIDPKISADDDEEENKPKTKENIIDAEYTETEQETEHSS
jgi:hypothetical protein